MLRKQTVLAVEITSAKKEEILEYIFDSLQKPSHKYYIVTPNPEIIVYASKHPKYRNILNQADLALADGVGIILAGLILRKPFRQRIAGVDFVDLLCRESVGKAISIGLLGGKAGVAERAAECLRKKYPGVKVLFASSDPDKLLESPNSLILDILFVAFGHPKQEEWISENLDRLPVKVAMGVGGAFDYISGQVRAPYFIRRLGLEWLFRLIREPWRWSRQLALIEYALLVLRDKLK